MINSGPGFATAVRVLALAALLSSSGTVWAAPLIMATNTASDSYSGLVTLQVTGSTNGGSLSVATTSLPNATAGTFYSTQLAASGGQSPYNWYVAGGSAPLPQFLTLNSSGLLSGIPAFAGTNNFSVQVLDMNSSFASLGLSLIVTPGLPLLSGPAASPGGPFRLTLNGALSNYYNVEYSTNLTNWTLLYTTNLQSGTFLNLTFPDASAVGFYRAYKSEIVVSQLSFGYTQTSPFLVANPNTGAAVIPVNAQPTPGSPGITNQICLNYSTIDGTARSNMDYTAQFGTVCFAPGTSSNNIVIPLNSNSTNVNATFYLQLSSPDGSQVLITPVVIRRPQPVLAVYPTALTIVVPGNCGQSITISNAGPQGSVLNYTVADDGALGGYLNLNGAGSSATGSLPAGQTAQVAFTVLDQFATNWIGGDLTTAPSIYTPGAANYLKYPLSVRITTSVQFTVAPVIDYDEQINATAGIAVLASGFVSTNNVDKVTNAVDGTLNATASDVSTTVNAFAGVTTTVGTNSISFNGSAVASGTVTENYPPHDSDGYGSVIGTGQAFSSRAFTISCRSAVTIAGTVSINSTANASTSASCSLSSGSLPTGNIFVSSVTNNQAIAFSTVLEAGQYYFQQEGYANFYDQNGFGDPAPGVYNSSVTFNATLTLTAHH